MYLKPAGRWVGYDSIDFLTLFFYRMCPGSAPGPACEFTQGKGGNAPGNEYRVIGGFANTYFTTGKLLDACLPWHNYATLTA